MNEAKNISWDFFFRAESNRVDPRSLPAFSITLELAANMNLEDALAAARAAGMPKGSYRTGCFEVQNDLGIWEHATASKIDLSTPRKAAKVSFRTWDQVEADELAAA